MSDVSERELLDSIGGYVAKSFMRIFGVNVSPGSFGRYDDDDVDHRETPIRAIMMEYNGDFQNQLFIISSIHEDSLEPAAHHAVRELNEAFGADNPSVTVATHVFETREVAVEELEALFGLATLNIHTPKGDVLLVAAPEFLDSVSKVQHDPARRRQAASTLRNAPPTAEVRAFEVTDPEVAALLGIEPTRAPGRASTPALVAAAANPALATPAAAPAGFTTTDPEVAKLLGIDVTSSSPEPYTPTPSPALSATGEANAASVAAAQAPLDRWSRLLSGVEVDVSAELGSTRMRLGDVTGLHLDSVLTLDQHVDDPVNVFVNGTLFATARLVVVDDEYGIEIISVHETASNGSLATPLAA
ncbi:MAG: FliM/FliN family flagellar motor switch protein [Thermoleophilia bacterium]|nr:FliM/FliN family flagellar motor switch protein [Thermoleophilia bacterium]